MLFHSSIRKELSRSFGATLIVLVTVVMTMTLIRTLGLASRGSFNPSDVFLVMGYTVLAYMPTLLTLGLFIAIISTLTRMFCDSEMVIWQSSGQGLFTLVKPLLRFSWPVFAVVAGLALVILPWTNLRIEELKNQYQKRGDLERVEPGRFQESADGSRVFFVDKEASGNQAGANVFIATTEKGKETVTSARSGRVENRAGGQFLLLDNGQRLERTPGSEEIKLSEFEQYGIQISQDVLDDMNYVPVATRTTAELLKDQTPVHWAEMSWRLGLILASFNFVIIGVIVSSVNPRMGRSSNLVFALFTFVLYYNLLSLGQNLISSGKLSFVSFMLGLHGGVFVLTLLLLARLHHNLQWREIGSLLHLRRKRPVP
ncbi:MAG: LPS export ABC transporter permease LptF [Rhodoferax sp.]|nr:LPS export ABC transporter permease LptF [Rhodoferax sp.]